MFTIYYTHYKLLPGALNFITVNTDDIDEHSHSSGNLNEEYCCYHHYYYFYYC